MGLYSNISDESLIKTLRQRLNDKEIIDIVLEDPETGLEEILTHVVNRLVEAKKTFGTDEVIDTLLNCESVKNDMPNLSISVFKHMFDRIRERFYTTSSKRFDFENKYLPDIDDLIEVINDNYIGRDPVLDTYENDALLEALRGSSELDEYVEEDKEDSYNEGFQDGKNAAEDEVENKKEFVDNLMKLEEKSPDDLWMFFCDQAKCSYYDEGKLADFFKMVKDKLAKSSFKQLIVRNSKK